MLVLGFVVFFLVVFTLCMVITLKFAQAREDLKDWKAMKTARHRLAEETAEAKSDLVWRGNKGMVMY